MLTIDVTGRPAPQGSKRSVGNNRFIESSKYLPAWRDAVKQAAAHAAEDEAWETLAGPVAMDVVFYLERPKTVPATKRREPITPPDIDKLCRAVSDSLTDAQVYEDDSQIVELTAVKRYADARDPGCFIVIRHAGTETETAQNKSL